MIIVGVLIVLSMSKYLSLGDSRYLRLAAIAVLCEMALEFVVLRRYEKDKEKKNDEYK